jgi:tetratricopeptide (TPR) repeat protein
MNSKSKQKREPKLTPEAKLHLQQGMTYITIAKANPGTAKENYSNALMEFNNAIEDYPNYEEAYSNRAVIYMLQKKYNKAEIDLLKAAEINPKDPYVQYNLAALYSLQKKTDLGLDALDRALENGFNNFSALKPKGKGSDPDLKNLRKDPGYKEVLEKHKVFILK